MRPVISALIAGYHSTIRVLSAAWVFLLKVFRRGGFGEITVTFLTEVAVLVMVLPIVDTIVEKGQAKVTLPLVIWSIVIALGCLFAAGIIFMSGRED
jgi:hypothetical protein